MYKIIISIVVFFLIWNISFSQDKEILIVGTMHYVSWPVKNSYKPLYKKVEKYNPEAVYTEWINPKDSLSFKNVQHWSSYRKFLKRSDSLQIHYSFNSQLHQKLIEKPIGELTFEELDTLKSNYVFLADIANYQYTIYLKRFLQGNNKRSQNETGDLSAKVAFKLGLKQLYSVDDQQTNHLYSENWAKCDSISKSHNKNRYSRKLFVKLTVKEVLSTCIGRYGKQNNTSNHLKGMHKLNAFQYFPDDYSKPEPCNLATQYWNERNTRIANNLAKQVLELPHQKSVLVIGAGHVIGVKEVLEKDYPEIKVVLLNEL